MNIWDIEKVGKQSATFIYSKHLFFHRRLQEVSKTYKKSWKAFGNSLCTEAVNSYNLVSCSWRWIQWEICLGFHGELDSRKQFSPHSAKALDSQTKNVSVFLSLHLLWSVLTGEFFMDPLQLTACIQHDHCVRRSYHTRASLTPLE